ncbi:UNVERIFIED_CONTAM: hypothetical protein FKN15_038660 [Acipenser sinensis]
MNPITAEIFADASFVNVVEPMNLASQSGEAGSSQLLFANFNQDNTSLAVGTKSGYKFFSLSSVDKLEQIYECTDTEDVSIVERLFSSSLVAIVSLKAPRKLKVCHFKKGTEICNYSYSNTILAVKLNRQITPGLCALSINNDNCYLAYPGSATIGEVQVFDTINLRAANMIPAHDSPLAALAFDASGTKLATASEKGTVIRVFSIPEGQKLFEFRRGVKRCVSICSLAFSMEGLFLSASSNTETVHIFKLETQKEKLDESVEPANEILEPTTHDRPLVAQIYSAAVAKGYSEDQGAVGGVDLDDDMNSLRLDEENEQPPMILQTD